MTNDKPASDGGASFTVRAEPSDFVVPKRTRMTVEEQYNAERGIKKVPPLKRGLFARFRSAITGLFVSKKYAEANPDTTIREKAD